MKTKNRIWISPLVIILMGLLCLSGFCTKDNVEEETGSITDKDGNLYTSVTIGSQTWMKENLKTTKYNDGSPIPLITDISNWTSLNTSGYCWYDNNEGLNKNVYGALYNWHTVNTNKLCPAGWHVPTIDEWESLESELGGKEIAGGDLKEAGTDHWISPNTGATNNSGFSALPAGRRDYSFGDFKMIGINTNFWSATAGDYLGTPIAYTMGLSNTEKKVYSAEMSFPRYGFSVRCIKD